MADLLIALPELPDPQRLETHWWQVAGDTILSSGQDAGWTGLAATAERIVALAPAGAVRTSAEALPDGATPRQAAAAARLRQVDGSLGDREALHAVSNGGADGVIRTAVADNGAMLAWLDWLQAAGADPHHIVPVSTLLPFGEGWTSATIGGEHLVGRAGLVLANEPELAERIVADAEVQALGNGAVDALLVSAAAAPPLDLRQGRFARRRRILFDASRVRELALIAALVPLLTLAWALVSIFKLDAATDQLNVLTLQRAEAVLGRPVTLETAEAALVQRAGGTTTGGVMVPLAGLMQALQPEANVAATTIAYTPDGTMSVTLAAPTTDAVNRVLAALQRTGYRLTAVPRQGSDGRATIDMTLRSGG